MKKQLAKITLKTDKIVSLTKAQAQNVAGGMRPSGNESKWVNTRPTCL
ncbi:class I lanthipeptide [Spirosoma gilvum]